MLLFLRFLFIVIFGAMLWVTSWASVGQPIDEFIAGPDIRNRWVIATLFEAYFAFIAFSLLDHVEGNHRRHPRPLVHLDHLLR
ncbi:MAG: hypothetical protein CK548_00220 [Opitutia bacterium]|nr:MAG: hypothetical protein CK548_00220 [Opitutae bacterium]